MVCQTTKGTMVCLVWRVHQDPNKGDKGRDAPPQIGTIGKAGKPGFPGEKGDSGLPGLPGLDARPLLIVAMSSLAVLVSFFQVVSISVPLWGCCLGAFAEHALAILVVCV
ncbi:hypothetical protein NP493_2731g00005 [Ridgeia piscesae]|uniref:Uncharacterized protein n=1 Tax=Ridgeia piscesae TaxID=27915 RepID=A0AAD9JCR3_RIDPI|nr:hypothetical protein NP493_2731g00005 [Ridgeia piscesae]